MYEKISEKILERIRFLKNQKGLSDEELYQKTNIYLPFLSSLIKGTRNNASLDTLDKLANALDITLLDLLKSLNIK